MRKSGNCERSWRTRPENAPLCKGAWKRPGTAIGALHHDNTLLRQELAAHGASVIPLHSPRGHARDET